MTKSSMKGTISSAALGALTNSSRSTAIETANVLVGMQNPLEIVSDKMKNSEEIEPDFTGVARSMICVRNGDYNNFQICTLYIEHGKVMRMERSDMWASFEAFAFLEMISKQSCDHLNNNFQHGKAMIK